MSTTYFGLDTSKLKNSKGADAGFMVNPQSIYYNEAILTSLDKQRDKAMIELREVEQETFDYYFKFLETGNVTYLRHAERSVA